MKKTLFILLTFNTGLSLAQLRAPEGFAVSVYADNIPNARSLALGDKGIVFVGTGQQGNVYALQDSNADGIADKKYVVASKLTQPTGVAYQQDILYVAEINRITRYNHITDNLAHPPKAIVVYNQLPSNPHHGWKYLRMGPDNKLYTAVGAPCNICKPESPFGSLVRLNTDGSQFEIIATGIRNSVGFDWQPNTNSLFFTDNGRDYLGDDSPPEELNRWSKVGEHFGFPYYHGGTVADPQYSSNKKKQDFTAPLWTFNAHVAPLGIHFYRGNQFPSTYKNQLLVVQHGSWNRSKPDGYRIVLVNVEHDKPVSERIFMDGWLDKNDTVLGRPVDILEMPDGSLLISDDQQGIIYSVTYKGKP